MNNIIGESKQICKIRELIKQVANSNAPILITGETGTGKELIARNIHYNSINYNKPFTAIHCAAIPNDPIKLLIGGTLFLVEIGELEPSLQAKLLRLLQEKEFEFRENDSKRDKFRLISSTRFDLREEIKAGKFRKDLFDLLNVIQIDVLPLRERRLDIPLLAADFLHEFCLRERKMLKISDEVMSIFMKYTWPGNVRELRKSIERAVVLAKESIITPEELPEELLQSKEVIKLKYEKMIKKDLEPQAIKDVLIYSKGNKSEAAKILGLSRPTLYNKLKKISQKTYSDSEHPEQKENNDVKTMTIFCRHCSYRTTTINSEQTYHICAACGKFIKSG